MKKSLHLICACCMVVLTACTKELHYTPAEAETMVANGEVTVTLSESGTLELQLKGIPDIMSITKLNISGPINGTDLKFIREMAGSDSVGNETNGQLQILDLRAAQLVKGGMNPFIYKGTPCPMDADNTIPRYGFGYCKLREIRLPESITCFSSQAFFHCDSLESVNIPESLQEMYYSVFCYCGKLQVPIVIPQTITEIYDFTFDGCMSIPKITLHDKVKIIGESAFENCKQITDLGSSLPELDSIAPSTFYKCTKLQKLYLPEKMSTVPAYAFAQCNGIKEVQLKGKTVIDKYAFYGCHGLTSLSLPAGLKVIGAYAFGNSEVGGAISIPQTVCEVGMGAFCNTNITSVEINSNIETGEIPNVTLPNEAFESCNNLKSLKVAEGVTTLKISFSSCKALDNVQLPSTLKTLGEEADYMDFSRKTGVFANCKALVSAGLPEGLEMIGYRAFKGCSSMRSVSIPSSTKKIEAQAFHSCEALTSFTIPKQVSGIGSYVLSGCTNLENVSIEMAMEEIPQGLFEGCTRLSSFTFPAHVRTIGYEAFKNSGLTSVSIPDSVAVIENMAFMNCTALKKVEMPSTLDAIQQNAFAGCINLCEVTFASNCQLKEIGASCFYQCMSLVDIALPPHVTTIGQHAFNASGLSSIVIPASTVSIGDMSFANCLRMQTITNYALQPQVVSASVFDNLPLSMLTLQVPSVVIEAYRNASVWADFGHITGM